MSHGLAEILRYFLLALLWLFFLYAARTVLTESGRRRLATAPVSTTRAAGRRASWHLRIVDPPDRNARAYELDDDITLGRSPACAIALERDTFASSVHARIFSRDGEPWVEDLGSRNGTFLNDQRLHEPVPLQRGDRVKIGTTTFEVGR